MKKMLCTVLVFLLTLAMCACGQKTETVEITMDNWDEYFEFRTVTRWQENAFGETSMVEYPMALCVKEAYEDRIVMDQVDLAVECSWEENDRYVSIDWEDQSMKWGDVVNSLGTTTQINNVTEIRCWEAYESAYVVVYLRDIGLSLDTILRDEQGKEYALCMENGDVIRIQGTIVIRK